MALVDDVGKDQRTKSILGQTNTKTVGPPDPTTGLIGDQEPASVFKVSDFDKVRNQINLEAANIQLLDVLNILGQITNTQSTSGPIPNTSSIKVSSQSSTGNFIAFRPDSGQVWQVMAMSLLPSGSGSYRGIGALVDENGNAVELFDKSGTGTAESLDYDTPIFLTRDVYLQFTVVTVDTSLTLKAAVVRVR
jgi:hypothetical protein